MIPTLPPPVESKSPSWFISFLFLFMLMVIHAIDMILTREVIGHDWQEETFLPMRYCMRWFGLYNALDISRISMYTMIFIYLCNWKSWKWFSFLVAGTCLYWISMVHWLWILGYVDWP